MSFAHDDEITPPPTKVSTPLSPSEVHLQFAIDKTIQRVLLSERHTETTRKLYKSFDFFKGHQKEKEEKDDIVAPPPSPTAKK